MSVAEPAGNESAKSSHVEAGAGAGRSGHTPPTLDEACEACRLLLDLTDRLWEQVHNRRDALLLGLPDRQVQVDDITVELRAVDAELEKVKAYTQAERSRHGW